MSTLVCSFVADRYPLDQQHELHMGAGMLFRFGWMHRMAGWLLTLWGLVALAVGARDYWIGAAVRPGWVVGGLTGIVAGTALVRWSRRARPD